ncbi:MAG TPA: formate dehydrogenase accessory protein FdhE [Geobacteraceae bacterium]
MTEDITDPLLNRLNAVTHDHPELGEAARLYGAILPLVRDADLRVSPPPITPDEARARLARRVPLLPGLDLELDGDAVRGLMLRLARGVAASGVAGQSAAAEAIRTAIAEGKLDPATLVMHAAAGKDSTAESLAQELGLDAQLLILLARTACKPALRAWQRQLAPLMAGIQWDRGFCFVCGAAATMGELRGNGQARHLRCSQCGADWRFERLACVRCGNSDHATRHCMYVEGRHEEMRLDACELCKGYLKVIAAFDPTPVEMLSVEDLATLHLDYIARAHGYGRGRGP